ncbi:hydantoinase B/oxoprolinase family protein [Nocardia jiangxiensis]|uniref:Hydantoinase B/oxoprolinase family protein n=1 Tax=Nocardia jiangxiensis TaxID=282685 RepID=A0ABW6S9U9_9NOCA
MSADPILTAVIQRKLVAIAEEMATTLLRTTRSALLSQAGDLGTAVLGADGELLAGAEYVPVLALSLKYTCESVARQFAGELHPGDVILHNDVFSGGAQTNDVGVLVPVFVDGELLAWVATRGHQLDIGGPVPGGANPLARDVYQEALQISAVKVVDRGSFRPDVWNLIFTNIRARETVEADMRAQIGACGVGARELTSLVDQYGVERFGAYCSEMLSAGENMMRSRIAAVPDGIYRGSSVVNDDARGHVEHFEIVVTITVADDELTVDYTGSSVQAPGYTNAPAASSGSATMTALFGLLAPDIPHNDGVLRPVRLVLPEGSIVNPRPPAATFYGNFMAVHIYEAVMDAMRSAMPDQVTAGWNRAYDIRTSGRDPRTGHDYNDIHFLGIKGGSGALAGSDGYSQGSPVFAPALRTEDYEISELQHPHFLIRHEYLTDSAGAGQWRGGLGVVYECRIDADQFHAVTQGDGLIEGAHGINGGLAGTANRIEVITPDGVGRTAHAMQIFSELPAGTVIRQHTGGGGGYGNPRHRDHDLVRADVADGLVSARAAHRLYGLRIEQRADE